MKKVVLLGSPVAHSLSPVMYGAAFVAAELDWHYEAIEVDPPGLPAAIRSMRADGWAGANVTIPLKEKVLPLLDELDASAAQTLASNTIVNEGGRLVGHNTDLPGFLRDLQVHWQVPRSGHSLILGAGGAARAVAFGLAQLGLELRVIGRSASRTESLAEDVRRAHPVEVTAFPWTPESFEQAAGQCRLVVNTTPLGMLPPDRRSPWPEDVQLPPDAFAYDLVYTSPETPFVRQARLACLEARSGAGMLLEQGALSYELWTGLAAPRERMRTALDSALEHTQAQAAGR